jgi:hypothetical protein
MSKLDKTGTKVKANKKTQDLLFDILSSNPTPIPPAENSWPQPSWAYMLEVSLDVSSGSFEFKYKRMWKKRLTAGGDAAKHAQFLAWIVSEVANPSPPNNWNQFDTRKNIRKPSKMSFNCDKLIYLVIKLAPNLNWRFTADAPPISMDSFWQGKDVFFKATNLNALGVPVKSPAKNNAYKYAYVIIDCPKGAPGVGDIPGAIEARFNLHVDLMEGPDDDDPYVPIIIDPDVRNPGGGGG